MAKRGAASKDGVNVSREVFAIVDGNQSIRGPEVLTILKDKYPNVTFNNNSVQVAFANARRKLGLTRTLVKRPKKKAVTGRPKKAAAAPVASSPASAAPAAAPQTADISRVALEAARDLLRATGCDASAALEALRIVASLQMT
ncbi:MAG: hypothetical protein RLZZ458_3417 [Planctomycetota bacterium]|jgi:hypothetical protein